MIQFIQQKIKMPILNGRINYFKFARLLFALSIDRSFDYYKMLIFDKKNQYFYVREGENRPADSYPPACINIDYFSQKLRFVELIDPVSKIDPHLVYGKREQ